MDITTGRYVFGAEHGELLLHTARTGLGRRAGHDLTLRATRWTGTAEVGDGTPLSTDVRVDVAVAGLEVLAGTGGVMPLTDADRAQILDRLRSDRLLHAARHPTITYRSDAVAGTAESFRLEGHLTVAGASHPLTVTGGRSADGRVRGSATVTQSRWGIRPYTALLGALRLADDVRVEFDVLPVAAPD